MKDEKTNKEIFEQKYPLEELAHDLLLCAEAIGYLKALMIYFPHEEKWAKISMSLITLLILSQNL